MVINFILIEKRLQIGVEVATRPIYIYIYIYIYIDVNTEERMVD